MKKMTSAELRTSFLSFFQQRGHCIQPSSSLVPSNDPTLLFTNAGMVPFKDVLLGKEQRSYTRAVTTQRCVRAGGKHNDLENVGYTARHHTFFEMLGNFSFGDYFKQDAIYFAWEFLTKTLEIPPAKLWITVFDEDQEAASIWLEQVKIDPSRFSRIGGKDNFWSMGDVGPCGPCTEIFYDHGETIAGGPPGTADADGDRYVEIWNLVFMQYDRDQSGQLHPLPAPSVDTGMGLERITAVLQGVHSNYDIDLFQNLLTAAAALAATTDLNHSSLRVIADHIRACVFIVVDGVLPANEGRGYVLRRIIRRAIRHGYRLGIKEPFFYKLVAPLVAQMGAVFPAIKSGQAQAELVLKNEEQRFAETLTQGMKVLENCVAKITGQVIPGDTVFLLYDTYGFPPDLTADFAREQNLTVDHAGFEVEMTKQRKRARAGGKFVADYHQAIKHDSKTDFVGYQDLTATATIVGLFVDGQAVPNLATAQEGIVVLDQTPCYAEAGGQVGDSGRIELEDAVFEISDTQQQGGTLVLHRGVVARGKLHCNQKCKVSVNAEARQATAANHSATHLLHAALRQTLGKQVAQKGSLVNPKKLRFDFSHFEPLTKPQISAIEAIVNQQIRLNSPTSAQIMAKDDALKAGAMALFGEKYGDQVRVLKIGEFSTELCGGTHVARTGAIACLKIISETGVAAGVRRIEAVTAQTCIDWFASREQALAKIAKLVKSPAEKATDKVSQLLEKNKQLEKELERLRDKLSSTAGVDLSAQAVAVNGINVVAAKLDDSDPKALRSKLDQLKNTLTDAAIVLATVNNGKVSLIAGVSQAQTKRIKAGDLVNFVAAKVGGKGGGRADMAQAGGNQPEQLEDALQQVPAWIKQQLKNVNTELN